MILFLAILKTLLKAPINLKIFILFILFGCSSGNRLRDLSVTPRYKKRFQLIDKSGTFFLEREAGVGRRNYFIQKTIVRDKNDSKILERSVLISKLGLYKNIKMARPEKSVYDVWFDGQKYQTITKIDLKNKTLKISLTSPEEQWNGMKEVKFPNKQASYCFFSQIVECASISGFINKAIELNNGKMNVIIIWEGYPYIQEQYFDIPKNVFTEALFSFDGKNKSGEYRFSLDLGHQKILYFVDRKKGTYNKIFWVSQGLSIINRENQ